MRRAWKKYSLGIVYFVSWGVCWALHAAFTYWADTYPHDAVPWLIQWQETTWENLASEYHQVGVLIVFSKYFTFKGSPQSKESDA